MEQMSQAVALEDAYQEWLTKEGQLLPNEEKDLSECWDKTGKPPVTVRWVDVRKDISYIKMEGLVLVGRKIDFFYISYPRYPSVPRRRVTD